MSNKLKGNNSTNLNIRKNKKQTKKEKIYPMLQYQDKINKEKELNQNNSNWLSNFNSFGIGKNGVINSYRIENIIKNFPNVPLSLGKKKKSWYKKRNVVIERINKSVANLKKVLKPNKSQEIKPLKKYCY